MSKIRLEDTGRYAHVEVGEWDGKSYELDEDYPVCRLSDGRLVVVLEGLDELPDRSESDEMNAVKDRRNGR